MKARAVSGVVVASIALAGATLAGWWATRPPPPDPLATWKGPSTDPHENRLRKLARTGGDTARLRVPPHWNARREEAIVVLLHTDADASGSAVATRFLGLMEGPWLLVLPEAPGVVQGKHRWTGVDDERAGVEGWVEQVGRDYRTRSGKILWIGEAESAGLAEAHGCAGGDAIVRRSAAPCAERGTAWAWISTAGRWQPVDQPTDPAAWFTEAVTAWNERP